eukprot:NODE_95_length_2139_cov_354.473608.p1 GENE.NODE_95_length_2139_cov_354.473608~~NODE_95_length_2139_cov_354.473608.p1  ORF type:complete len:594 (-),score=102.02 NODE_95_length_2139_cov_354.473608:326-2107(-)
MGNQSSQVDASPSQSEADDAGSFEDGGEEVVASAVPIDGDLDDAQENDSGDSKDFDVSPVELPADDDDDDDDDDEANPVLTQRQEKQAMKQARAAEKKELKEARAQEKAKLAQEAKERKLAQAQAAQEAKLAKAQAARELKLARANEKQANKDKLVQVLPVAEPEQDDADDEESEELLESACLEEQTAPGLTRREQKAALKLARAQEKEELRSARAQEKAMLKASRAQEKEALLTIRSEAKETLRVAQARRNEAMQAAKAQGREALAEAEAHWGTAAGRGEFALVCAGISAENVHVVLFNEENQPPPGMPAVPGQMVAVDQAAGCVVVALRGSSCLRDALVDLDCRPEPVSLGGLEGLAHGGMLRSAQELIGPLADAVDTALERLTGPRRILVLGHSLGAGVAALVTALWMDAGRFPLTEVKCLAYACPQVLDPALSAVQSSHTTSYVQGDDTVPCLGLASAMDLRDALVMIADPEARVRMAEGADLESLQGLSEDEVLAAAQRGDADTLSAMYASVRNLVGSHENRLFPSGRLVKMLPGKEPWEAELSEVDEMVVTTDMKRAHLPYRYLACVQEATAAGGATEALWSAQPAL